ncbi:MAG TPA: four helix bundle protein [Stellaceae bacterium]|jgi:four helix bundle protein|nr:four helix bundle protein [Stellaceae bacterium]
MQNFRDLEEAVSYQPSALSEGAAMQNFRELKVWSKAHAVALAVYAVTEKFPAAERYGLTAQMRRAATSVPANIAEGSVRATDPDFARFLQIALGSASELEYFALLARDLELMPLTGYEPIVADIQEVKRMLTAFIARLRADG